MWVGYCCWLFPDIMESVHPDGGRKARGQGDFSWMPFEKLSLVKSQTEVTNWGFLSLVAQAKYNYLLKALCFLVCRNCPPMWWVDDVSIFYTVDPASPLDIHLLCLPDHSYFQCLHPIFHLEMFLDGIYWYFSITFFLPVHTGPLLSTKLQNFLLSWGFPKMYRVYIYKLVFSQ